MDVIKSLEKSKRKYFSVKNNRICCTLTGHELPLAIGAVVAYANGKKFSRAISAHSAQLAAPVDWAKFLIDAELVESNKAKASEAGKEGSCGSQQRARLFCQLTCRFVANTPADIARHTGGRRFQSALAAYKTAQASGVEFKPNTSLYAKYAKKINFLRDGEACTETSTPAADDDDDDDGEDSEEAEETVDEEDDEEMEVQDDEDEDGGSAESEESEELHQELAGLPRRKRNAAAVVEQKSAVKKIKKN